MLCVLLVGTRELLNVLGSHTTCRDDSEGASSANVADSRMNESSLPSRLWKPLANSSADEGLHGSMSGLIHLLSAAFYCLLEGVPGVCD